MTIVKIEELLARQGVRVPYRTLHRFAVERCGFRAKADHGAGRRRRARGGVPDRLRPDGLLLDPETGKRRRVHALIFTAVVSRHMFVWLTYSQTLAAVIAGCEAAWAFFGGVFKVLIPDNLKPVVTDADAVNPQLSVGWLDYAQHVGFGTDPARVRSPQDKPRVERAVQYVRGNFWAGETFTDLADAQARVEAWCPERAGMRIHGTTAQRPARDVHRARSPVPACRFPSAYDVPVFTRVKVHRDFHVEVAKALYSVPEQLPRPAPRRPRRLRSWSSSTHARDGWSRPTRGSRPAAGPPTARTCPSEKAGYAMRDLTRLIAALRRARARTSGSTPSGCSTTRCPGPGCARSTGCSAWSAATAPARSRPPAHGPWTSTSCRVSKIASMLDKATEREQPVLPAAAGVTPGRPVRPRPQRVRQSATRPRQRPAHPHPRRR